MSTEDMIRALTINVTKMQQDMSQYPQETVLKELNLENQLKQVPNIVKHIGEEEEEGELTEEAQPEEEKPQNSTPPPAIPEIIPPFPEPLKEIQRVEKDKDLYEIFCNCLSGRISTNNLKKVFGVGYACTHDLTRCCRRTHRGYVIFACVVRFRLAFGYISTYNVYSLYFPTYIKPYFNTTF
ncbi:unnamed protein product [Cuscuta europaea]|uniref:Uncharacterized protein n=1 Tax=Cuscuta europaea TaxID=41803 RepID=A0A9P0YU73_CUSEU|nr:unnamed protein product [Cuscuta europaea]